MEFSLVFASMPAMESSTPDGGFHGIEFSLNISHVVEAGHRNQTRWPRVCVAGGFSAMASEEQYRQYAAECLKLSSAVRDPGNKTLLSNMATMWLRLAEYVEAHRDPDGQIDLMVERP